MALRSNLEYWQISLDSPEPIADDYYLFDEVIVNNHGLIQKVERLRELIIGYCVMLERDEDAAEKVLDEIYDIVVSIENIQYTEFVAFWKALDLSYSVFKKLPDKRGVLAEVLRKYCERRRRLYDALGYSNVVVQALYDSGTSRKKGKSGVQKLSDIIEDVFSDIVLAKTPEELDKYEVAYFLPESKNPLFEEVCRRYHLEYEFGREHQNKVPDAVLKVDGQLFLIEAKHIKEARGAQDKQVTEVIDFIKNSEEDESICYVSFMDGTYFNKFVQPSPRADKVKEQKEAIERHLAENKSNFFVNTAGMMALLEDLKDEIAI